MIGNLTKANDDWSYWTLVRNIARMVEKNAARAANARDYKLSPESRAALRRGDIQRATGVYQTEQSETNYVEGE